MADGRMLRGAIRWWLEWGMFLGFASLCAAQPWSAPTATARLRLEKTPGSAWPASAGTIEIWPGPPDANYMSVYTADGAPVNTQTYWSAGDEPAKMLVNTSSGKTVYFLYFDKNPPPSLPAWRPEVGLLLETRGCKNLPANTWPQLRILMKSATSISGRSYVPNIFQGINPHGPSAYYLAFYNGLFNAPQAGEYGFATVSTDASYLSIDGRLVAEWLGRHGPGGGRQGEHNGTISLTAGKHRIEYVQAQFDGAPAAVAAWKPPGRARYEVMPAGAFEPVANLQATAYETSPTQPETLYLEWQNAAHSIVDSLGVYQVRFHVLANRPRAYRWTFDDGGSIKGGASAQHLYLGPGHRQVTVEAYEGTTLVGNLKTTIVAHPHWAQHNEWRQDLYDQAHQELLGRDLSNLTSTDLLTLLELSDRVDDAELNYYAGIIFLKRQQEFNAPGHAVVYYKLGLNCEHRGDQGNQQAEQAWRLALGLSRGAPKLSEKAKLRLADLLVHSQGKLDEAATLLSSIATAVLTEEERRLARLLVGDLLAAQGKLEEAGKVYASLSAKPARPGENADIQHRAKLESAEIFFHRGDYATAERILDQMQVENPEDRLALEVQLPLLDIYLSRKEFQRTLLACQRLLQTEAGKPHESELLLDLAEAAFALDKKTEAREAVAKLIRNYPYSESAARAKDRWGAIKPSAK